MLGVVLDRRLTFDKHVMVVTRSCNFSCTSHPPYTPSIVDRSGTDTGLQSDPDETRLLQLGTLLVPCSQQHPEVAAYAEQCSQNRPPGTEAVPCQTADASTTLAAGSAQN